MPDGFVVDFTLEALERSREGLNGTHRPAEVLYFGVDVPQHTIREAMLSSGFIEPVALRLYFQRQTEYPVSPFDRSKKIKKLNSA